MVNYLDYRIEERWPDSYHNSWVDISIDERNVSALTEIGRRRWKIENETFNTLKNQGYHIEHNTGPYSGDICVPCRSSDS